MILGDLIKEFRKEHGYSMDAFAQKSGLSKAYISILERNVNPVNGKPVIPSLETIKAVAQTIGMDFNDVIVMLDGNQPVSLESTKKPTIPPDAIPFDSARVAPLLGTVRAGLPMYAEENIEGYIPITQNDDAKYFWLRVRGDSMNAAGMDNGDKILVREQPEVENGEIAVVLVNGDEATVKYFRQEGNLVILTPRSLNPIHQPQIYDLKKVPVRVAGRVIECRKIY